MLSSILCCFILKVIAAKRLGGASTASFLGKFTGGLLPTQFTLRKNAISKKVEVRGGQGVAVIIMMIMSGTLHGLFY